MAFLKSFVVLCILLAAFDATVGQSFFSTSNGNGGSSFSFASSNGGRGGGGFASSRGGGGAFASSHGGGGGSGFASSFGGSGGSRGGGVCSYITSSGESVTIRYGSSNGRPVIQGTSPRGLRNPLSSLRACQRSNAVFTRGLSNQLVRTQQALQNDLSSNIFGAFSPFFSGAFPFGKKK